MPHVRMSEEEKRNQAIASMDANHPHIVGEERENWIHGIVEELGECDNDKEAELVRLAYAWSYRPPVVNYEEKMKRIYSGLACGLGYAEVDKAEQEELQAEKDVEYLAWLATDRSTPYPPEKPRRRRERRR